MERANVPVLMSKYILRKKRKHEAARIFIWTPSIDEEKCEEKRISCMEKSAGELDINVDQYSTHWAMPLTARSHDSEDVGEEDHAPVAPALSHNVNPWHRTLAFLDLVIANSVLLSLFMKYMEVLISS